MEKRLTRPEVPVEQTWNLDDLFPTRADWEAEMAAMEAAIPGVTQYKGRLGESAATMRACLGAYEALNERAVRAGTWASLRATVDSTNEEYVGDDDRTTGLFAGLQAATSFIRSELLALPDGTVERYMEQEPGLAELRPYLNVLLQEKKHMLSPETEETVAALGELFMSPYITYNRAKLADMQFDQFKDGQGNERELSFALYEEKYETDADVTTRRNAFRAFAKGLKAYQNTMASTFAAEVKKNVVMARQRKYPSATHMLLQPQQVSLEAYENLLNIIRAELAPHMRRYAALRKRVLGLEELLYCDIEAPLDPGYSPKVDWDDATQMVMDALEVMGPEYSKIMRTAIKERWVDYSDNVGKATGAFCASPYGAQSYILMTWTGNMRGAFTLAHELGHAGHFQLANRNQRLFNTEPSTYFVEAPSTMNEILLGQHILAKHEDKRMRRWVIMQFLATYHHNFVRHLLEGELQRRIYALAEEGKPITANVLSSTKGAILEEFWGDAVAIDEGARLTWMRQPHYYMGLYPYTYSAGLTASTAMAQLIREEGEPAVQRWLTVLRAGGTMGPVELMKLAGVDMTSPEPIRKAVAYVGSLIDELERLF
ncbi:MAG TPA: oligoendopeptidase F [Symbiobacteriaceae bacterium]|jgi:oligoendopeptidase F|nr:oligoendopeptidase F [Symbiobacteriaceae bacterium]